MSAVILSIGDELLLGQISNTNASWLAAELTLAGIEVRRILVISDRKEDIEATLSELSAQAGLVFCTGGLGPTADDTTRYALCSFFNCGLKTDQQALKDIDALLSIRGFAMSERNRKQADVPDKCDAIRNEIGTSPGLWFRQDEVQYIFMPGVPFEMKHMFTDKVLPLLRKQGIGRHIFYRMVHTLGIGESALADRLLEWEKKLPGGIGMAYLPEPGIIKLRITASGDDIAETEKMVNLQVASLVQQIPDLIFAYDKDTMQSVVGKMLVQRGQTLCTAESCTGGYIAHLITSVPGSSEWYNGSLITYSDESKIKELNVTKENLEKFGAVSEQVVTQMASNARDKFGTSFSIAVSGIAGPTGGSKEKPVGTTWIAIASANEVQSRKFLLGDDRERNIRRASLFALNMLRMELKSNP